MYFKSSHATKISPLYCVFYLHFLLLWRIFDIHVDFLFSVSLQLICLSYSLWDVSIVNFTPLHAKVYDVVYLVLFLSVSYIGESTLASASGCNSSNWLCFTTGTAELTFWWYAEHLAYAVCKEICARNHQQSRQGATDIHCNLHIFSSPLKWKGILFHGQQSLL